MKSILTGLLQNKFIKCFEVSLVSLLIIIIFSLTAYAYTTVCYPDCDSSIWIPAPPAPAYTFIVNLPCGEPVIVSYRIRNACNRYWDVFIEQFSFVNGYNGGTHCGTSMSIPDMLNFITITMLVQDPMNFPPDTNGNDTCSANYRVIDAPCWSANFYVGPRSPDNLDGNSIINPMQPGIGVVTPCSFEKCCLQRYQVCIVNHVKTIFSGGGDPGVCDPQDPPNCVPVCNNN